MNKNLIEQNCPACGERWHIILNEPEYYSLLDYRKNGGYIQEKLDTLNACEREFIKTGYCPECQENIFGNGKTDRVKKVDKDHEKKEKYVGLYDEYQADETTEDRREDIEFELHDLYYELVVDYGDIKPSTLYKKLSEELR